MLDVLAAALIATAIAGFSKRLRVPFGIAAVIGFGTAIYLQVQPEANSTSSQPQAVSEPRETVEVTFTSDPSGAHVVIASRSVGTTPHTLEHLAQEPINYTIRADEPYDAYDLYKPYSGTMVPTEHTSVDVWLERTTLEEQQAQRVQYAEAQAEAEQRRLERELRASAWQLVRRTDSITDEERSYVIARATQYHPTVLEDDAYLLVRCDASDPTASDGIAIVINADDYLGRGDLELDCHRRTGGGRGREAPGGTEGGISRDRAN